MFCYNSAKMPRSPGFRVYARNDTFLASWSSLGMTRLSYFEEVIRFLDRVKKLKKYQAIFPKILSWYAFLEPV